MQIITTKPDLQNMQPGIYDLTNAEYHGSEGYSRSGLSKVKKSPLKFWEESINPEHEPEDDSVPFMIGGMVHTLSLEPHKFHDEYIVPDGLNTRTKEGKAFLEALVNEANGKIIVKKEHFELAKQISDAVIIHPKYEPLMEGAQIEKSLYWKDEETGLLCKARPDIWNPEIMALCDLKTSIDAGPDAFGYAVKKYDYHMQIAMQIDAVYYNTGFKPNFYFLVASTKKPYMPHIYDIEEKMIELGRHEYKICLKILKKCLETKKWDVDRGKVIHLTFSPYQLQSNLSTQLEIYS